MKLWSASKTGILPSATPPIGATLLVLAATLIVTSAAHADCQTDVNSIMTKRMSIIATINASAKKNGGKLDPVSACPQFKTLASVEGEASAYFAKNGEWCNLPPDYAQKMSQARAKTATMAARACQAVVMMKKMKEQQAQQAAEALPKLPTGPL